MTAPLAFVSGPFTAPTRAGVEANIARAVAVGIEVARAGAFPVIPHANTAHPDFEAVQPWQFWIDGDLRLLRACDCVVLVPGWQTSKGARGEIRDAHRRGLPIFDTVSELRRWMAQRLLVDRP